MVTFFFITASVIVMVALVVAGVAWLLPAASKAAEELRIETEVQDASWRIHQRATNAFGEMLQAARDAERQGRS